MTWKLLLSAAVVAVAAASRLPSTSYGTPNRGQAGGSFGGASTGHSGGQGGRGGAQGGGFGGSAAHGGAQGGGFRGAAGGGSYGGAQGGGGGSGSSFGGAATHGGAQGGGFGGSAGHGGAQGGGFGGAAAGGSYGGAAGGGFRGSTGSSFGSASGGGFAGGSGGSAAGSYGQSSGPVIPILVDERDGPHADGTYSFNFETGNGISRQEQGYPQGPEGAVVSQGGWSFTFPDGTPAVFNFVADENGYRVESDLLPTPHPLPAHALAQIEFARQQEAQGKPQSHGAYGR
ncbi:hypothetical protein O3P69_009746 [Scylla paramamosain]|uniref:Cuticle protein n=1 Tax=Scylla paramamosain TaxID=85552 RepID=A0AAW0SN45_SCYPA